MTTGCSISPPTSSLRHAARKHGLDPAQMAVAFATSRPFVTSTIIGATTLDQLKADIDGCLMTLPGVVLAGIEELHLTYPNPCP